MLETGVEGIMKQPYLCRIGRFCSVLLVMGLLGCSRITISFHPTDHSFQALPASEHSPVVYLDPGNVPSVPMRSVGLITIVGPWDFSDRELVQAAAAKGKELGCWAVIEHTVYLRLLHKHSFWDGEGTTLVIPVHGGGGGGGGQGSYGSVGGPPRRKTSFDCVVKDDVRA